MRIIYTISVVAIVGLSLWASTTNSAPFTKWFKTDNSTFYIETQQMYTWQQSYNECQKKNLSLISLKGYQEESLLTDYLKQMYDETIPEFWLKSSDNVDLNNMNQLLASIMAQQFLNIQANILNTDINSNAVDNCALSANGTGKACETLHGYICIDKSSKSNGGNVQNIVLNFS